MSDNTSVDKFSDHKYVRYRFKKELKKVTRAMSGLYKMAREMGIKDKTNVMYYLVEKVSNATHSYVGYKHQNLQEVLEMKSLFNEKKTFSRMDKERKETESGVRFQLSDKLSYRTHWKIEVKNINKYCGVSYTNNGIISKITVPITWKKYNNEIGSIGTNKVLVWAYNQSHPIYKCWRACFVTYKYENRQRKYYDLECYVMKDANSDAAFYHTDYKLCEAGMRRTIARKISKRIGG